MRLIPGSVDLCNLILVAEQTKVPVHSFYLASHSEFIRQLSLDVGPFSWKVPHVIEQPLQGYSSSAVHCLLEGVYSNRDMDFATPWQAWDLYKLTDHLHCPKLLKSC